MAASVRGGCDNASGRDALGVPWCMRRLAGVVATVVLVLVLGGCSIGDGRDDAATGGAGDAELTAGERFLVDANAICAEGNEVRTQAERDVAVEVGEGRSVDDAVSAAVKETTVPSIRADMQKIEAIRPDGYEDAKAAELRAAVDEALA